MKTVGDAHIWLKGKIKNLFSAEELPEILFLTLNFITGLTKTQIHAFPETELSEQQTSMLLLSVKKLQTGMPIQYVLGETEFFGLKLKVNPSVLIPRPETEELVAWVLEEKGKGQKGDRGAESGDSATGNRQPTPGSQKLIADSLQSTAILDIGTGSGCIPIAIKKNWPEAAVFALDISAEALQIAQANALLNEVEVKFFQQDILNFMPVKEALTYSIIVCNPPYIVPSEQKLMKPNVLNFEPHSALFVPKTDPLLFYRAVADYASVMLQKNGLLFFEINPKFYQEISKLLQEKGFVEISLKRDFSGMIRMIKVSKP